MSAARFAVFAERAAVVLTEARSIQNTPLPRDAEVRRELVKAKLTAADDINTFEAILYPPDETVN